jgi:hypothetical protein
MKTLIRTLGLATVLAFGAAACGGSSGAECDALAKKICDGKDEAYCKKARAWIDKEMVGPDGEKMSSEQTNMACKLIGEDKDVVAAYKRQAQKELGK